MPDFIVQWLVTRPGNRQDSIPARSAPRAAQASESVVRLLPAPAVQRLSGAHRSQYGARIEVIIRLIDISKWDSYNNWLAIGIKLKSLVLPEAEKFDIFKVAHQVSGEYR